jgi:hypothetical protein
VQFVDQPILLVRENIDMIWNITDLKEILILLVGIGLLGLLFILNIWQSAEYYKIQRAIAKSLSTKENLLKENEEINISILTKSSAAKIDSLFQQSIPSQAAFEKKNIHTLLLPKIIPNHKL